MTSHAISAQAQLLEGLQSQLKQHRQQVTVYRLLQSLPLVLFVLALTYAFSSSILYASLGAVAIASIIIWRLARSTELADIHLQNYLLHLNRCYPELEESAQLISRNPQELSLLQQLQQNKVSALLSTLLERNKALANADYGLKYPLILSVVSFIVFITVYVLADKLELPAWGLQQTTTELKQSEQQAELPNGISSVKISVQPPAYAQLPIQDSQELNISLLAGSVVKWQLAFKQSRSDTNYTIELSSGETLPLTAQVSGLFTASATINQSAIYTISSASGSSPSGKLDGVYTLKVTVDTAPQIRFLRPTTTTTEIAKDGLAKLETEVVVTDDFALSKVSIQASISKGSGEGVKFRDQDFEFDSIELIEGKNHYFKHWKLIDLDMEPGDEMYFSVLAWDNREPEAQLTRSPSKIIRWLEEEQSELATDGIIMDVMTEYFKSQRQIIIETEQLLVDKERLELVEFKRLSTELGFAQSDLKQKYGQYVGDEFAEGTLHTMEAGPALPEQLHEDDHDEDDDDHNDHASAETHEHEPEPQDTLDRSGASTIITQYGHNHGEAELGFTGFKGQPSPTALMKQAIANMWQAELHLMMYEPAKALPYEKQALKFLIQAKQAERIYVKRLGFEPPPVNESRRYQGELKDIKETSQQQQSVLPFAQQQLLSDSINTLQLYLDSALSFDNSNKSSGVNTLQYQAITRLLQSELENAPDNIQHIATLEKLSIDTPQLMQDCRSCIKQLQQKLWSLLPAVVASPTQQTTGFLLANPAIADYQQFLLKEQQP